MGNEKITDTPSRLFGRRISRRGLLVHGGALGVSTTALALLIACGGTTTPAPATAMPTMPDMPTPTTTSASPTQAASSVTAAGAQTSVAADVAGGMQVSIDNFSFLPKSLIVPAGTMVTWTNRDDIPHTVTSKEKKFTSQALDTDEQFSFTFTDPGTYAYFCAIHPIMTAEIVVK